MKRWAQQGFTIVELIIVIVVIGILATIVAVGYGSVVNNAHDTAIKTDLDKADDLMQVYALDTDGVFPSTASEMSTLNFRFTQDSYYIGDLANVYVCVNASATDYAIIAKSKSNKRFYIRSDQNVQEYTGSVVWDESTTNFSTTCTDIDPTFIPGEDDLAGVNAGEWSPWTNAE